MTQYFIIGGTEKAGTTSVFSYLSNHPQVQCSNKKETDFFRASNLPPETLRLEDYHRFFDRVPELGYMMEASPGYLVDSTYSARAIAATLPDVRLLFILRNPVDRLRSSFRFHKSRFYLPESLMLAEYVRLCLGYERGEVTPETAGMKEWFLRVLDAGRYFKHLQDYYAVLPRDRIKVMSIESLNRDPLIFMLEVCAFLDIDPGYFKDFEFRRANVTFSGKSKVLHRLGLAFNDRFERLFIRYPHLKQGLLAAYKTVNGAKPENETFDANTLVSVRNFYADDIAGLLTLPGVPIDDFQRWQA